MLFWWFTSALLGGLVVAAEVGAATTVNSTHFTRMPRCAVDCLEKSLLASPCLNTSLNQACLCADVTLGRAVSGCVQAQCSVRDALAATNISLTECGTVPISTTAVSIEFYATFTALTTAFILARLINKIAGISDWGWDDATILVAYALHMATSLAGTLYGMTGREIWALTPRQIDRFFFMSYIYGIRFMVNMALIKASILFALLRIFPKDEFRRILWSTLMFNTVFTVTTLGFWIGQCQPVELFWTGWDDEHQGTCLDKNILLLTHAAIHLTLDVWILVLPINQVAMLNLKKRKKFGAMIMFGSGVFLTVASVMRLNALVDMTETTDITSTAFWAGIWSNIENSVGIMVACMPAMRGLFTMLIIPKLRKLTGIPQRPPSAGSSTTTPHHKARPSDATSIFGLTNSAWMVSPPPPPPFASHSSAELVRRLDGEGERDVELGEMGDLELGGRDHKGGEGVWSVQGG